MVNSTLRSLPQTVYTTSIMGTKASGSLYGSSMKTTQLIHIYIIVVIMAIVRIVPAIVVRVVRRVNSSAHDRLSG